MITRLECLHTKTYIHRNLKPSHILCGQGKKSNTMFLIDLSLAKRYICPSSGEHIKFKKKTFSYLPSDAKSPFHEENK